MLRVLLIFGALCGCIHALDNGLARTPPMGWLAWERFRCNIDCKNDPKNCISEQLFMEMADRMVEDGYLDAGYEYINIDDCWSSKQRDSQGRLQADPDRFPSGIKALADYVHKRGLKLGIYGDYGNLTCGGYPGSLGHLEVDANTFAEWGVDMFKMDGCYADPKTMKKGYPEMTKYLNQTGRPILFSCSWPDYERASGIEVDYKLVAENCNIWRNYDDIQDSWQSVLGIVDYYAKEQDTLAAVQGPGSFNDPDMIIVGDFGLSYEQAKAQIAMWTIFAAPMLMSNDLRTIRPEFRELLLNKEVININQDSSGHFGKRVLQDPKIDVEIWTRQLQNDEYLIAIMSRYIKLPLNVNTTLAELGIPHMDDGYTVAGIRALGSNIMQHLQMKDRLQQKVNPSGVAVMKAIPFPSQSRTKDIKNSRGNSYH
ncbi:alpha-N-acetylgalactosaminidase-like isoform X1 [Lytechinus variegatus]|uniref:alpha-N-acetylgalactosaminidase-like isoform X1 n=1 Tax=Lytechinus variegatus TaxID=7654 RepID=UPI001BB15AFF|nr:alpha-N-acetylgalactosaminidase-like isoform X1 [Lytechinus variegatus]